MTRFFLLLLPAFLLGSLELTAATKYSNRRPVPRRPSSTSQVEDKSALQKVLSIEDLRSDKDHYLAVALSHPSRRVVRAALLAIARLQDPDAIEKVSAFLNRKDKEFRSLAAFTLGQIGGELGYRLLSQHIQMHKDPEIRAQLLLAIGQTGNQAGQALIESILKTEENPLIQAAGAQALGYLWLHADESWTYTPELLIHLGKQAANKEPVALWAAFALSRFRGNPSLLPLQDLSQAITHSIPGDTRLLLYRAVGKSKSPSLGTWLAQQFAKEKAPSVRIEILKALKGQAMTPDLLQTLKSGISDPLSRIAIVTLEAAATQGPNPALGEMLLGTLVTSTSPWIQKTALKTLAQVHPEAARKRVLEIIKNPKAPLHTTALTSLVLLGTPADLETLTGHMNNLDSRTVVQILEALLGLPAEKIPSALKNLLQKYLMLGDLAVTALVSELAMRNSWVEYADSMVTVYSKLSQDSLESKVAILSGLSKLGNANHVSFLEKALTDSEKPVVVAAAEALKAVTGQDYSSKVPLNSTITGPAPFVEDILASVGRRVLFKTTRGDIMIRTVGDGPITAFRILKLIREGFYKDKIFHRVVPGFVIQGGDPRGDGYGGPGYFIRDEVSTANHKRGSVGIATAGKDTGGSQFFINLETNPHLNGRYTIFAEVISGMDVAERIEPDDRILSAIIQ